MYFMCFSSGFSYKVYLRVDADGTGQSVMVKVAYMALFICPNCIVGILIYIDISPWH